MVAQQTQDVETVFQRLVFAERPNVHHWMLIMQIFSYIDDNTVHILKYMFLISMQANNYTFIYDLGFNMFMVSDEITVLQKRNHVPYHERCVSATPVSATPQDLHETP